MKISYNKGQMDNFKKSLEDAKKRMFEAARTVITASVMDVATTAKQPGYVPYLTGNLRRSITYKVELGSGAGSMIIGYVGTNVEYGRIQEYGGRGITGRLYMTRSIKDNTEKIKDRFKKISILKR